MLSYKKIFFWTILIAFFLSIFLYTQIFTFLEFERIRIKKTDKEILKNEGVYSAYFTMDYVKIAPAETIILEIHITNFIENQNLKISINDNFLKENELSIGENIIFFNTNKYLRQLPNKFEFIFTKGQGQIEKIEIKNTYGYSTGILSFCILDKSNKKLFLDKNKFNLIHSIPALILLLILFSQIYFLIFNKTLVIREKSKKILKSIALLFFYFIIALILVPILIFILSPKYYFIYSIKTFLISCITASIALMYSEGFSVLRSLLKGVKAIYDKLHNAFLINEINRNYLLYVLLIPALFFIAFMFINFKVFMNPGFEDGDVSSYALQIIRAKSFQEYLGPYSRFHFNHPGPISFYYYALMEIFLKLLPNPLGQHLMAQFLLNIFFLFISLHILYVSLEKKYLVIAFFINLLFCLYPLQNNIFMRLWPPFLLIFPMITFTLSIAKVSSGELKFLFVAVISSIFIIQNNVSGIVIVVPFFLIAFVLFFWNCMKFQKLETEVSANGEKVLARRRFPFGLRFVKFKPKYFSLKFSKADIRIIVASLLFLFIAFLPPLYEQFSSERGNISKIFDFFKSQKGFQHSFWDACNYVFNFYKEPLKALIKFDPLILTLILVGVSLINLRKERNFINYLILFVLLGISLSIFGAMKITGEMMPYIFNYEAAFVSFLYFAFIISPLRLIKIPNLNKGVLLTFLVISTLLIAFRFFRVTRIPPDPKFDQIIEAIKPDRQVTYELFWRNGGQHHDQWAVATRLALKLIRQGYDVCVPEEWQVIFGKKLICNKKKNIQRIALYSTDRYVSSVREHSFSAGGTTIEWGKMKRFSIPLTISFDSPDEYFVNWYPASENARGTLDHSARIILPLDKIDPAKKRFLIKIMARSSVSRKTKILINGLPLTETSFNPESMEEKSFPCEATLLKSHEENSIEFFDLHDFKTLTIQYDKVE